MTISLPNSFDRSDSPEALLRVPPGRLRIEYVFYTLLAFTQKQANIIEG
jgi:hypothetical protein